jgi:hypothetical protein
VTTIFGKCSEIDIRVLTNQPRSAQRIHRGRTMDTRGSLPNAGIRPTIHIDDKTALVIVPRMIFHSLNGQDV